MTISISATDTATATAGAAIRPVLAQAMDFTACYRAHQHEHPALREAACLERQYPALMGPIAADALFAGARAEHRICYVGSIWWTTMADECGPSKQGGYCFDFGADKRYDFGPEELACYRELKDFWRDEHSCAKVRVGLDEEWAASSRLGGQLHGGEACGFCVALDMDRLLQRGIPGLQADVATALAAADAQQRPFYQGLAQMLETVIAVCRHYEAQARAQLAAAGSDTRLQRIADSLGAIAERPPGSLHEAMQLLWLYSMLAGGLHIEAFRIDVALGDFLADDLDSGRLSEEEATAMTLGLWRMWQANGDPAVCRMVVGGCGRRNPANADRFCAIAIEATRRHHDRIPQLSLRHHAGQDPALMRQAFDAIGEGCVFPVLYNDDVILPGVVEALGIDACEAESYHPLGCGEYMIGGRSPSLLNFGWSIPGTLEAALRGGCDQHGRRLGPPCPQPTSMEQLEANLRGQTDAMAEVAARVHASHAAVLGGECAFLLASLLTDDCLARGRSLLDGGVRHAGACIMGHGFTNAADSLHSVRRLVFEQGELSLPQLLAALDADFEGHGQLRQRLLAQPKFGNDDAGVDEELDRLWRMISRSCAEAGRRHGLAFLAISSVNPGGYYMGRSCGATADGRRCGQPFAIGNAPTAGMDRSGLTALFNSLARVGADNGGAVSNIKLAKGLFTQERPKLEALFDVYWKQGGIQASVSVVDQEELEDAMVHPEDHPHLLVRLGGWTARFVELERMEQEEIIRRSVY